jgi:hypothetical protein
VQVWTTATQHSEQQNNQFQFSLQCAQRVEWIFWNPLIKDRNKQSVIYRNNQCRISLTPQRSMLGEPMELWCSSRCLQHQHDRKGEMQDWDQLD